LPFASNKVKYGESYAGRKFKTVFVEGAVAPGSVVAGIREAGRLLDALGLTPDNAGNISVRTERGMFITVGGVNKGKLTSQDVVEVIDFDFEWAKVVGSKDPSSETPMHWLIYHSYPEVNAVIHVHDDLAVDNADRLKTEIGIQSTEEETHYGTQDQAFQVVDALELCQYAVVKKHGIVCIGSTLSEALGLVTKIHSLLKHAFNPRK
jgi:L-fuculose-phosphate aldolase